MWTAPVDGGRAYRLTADGVPVARPRISPDGALVAWTSTRERAPEVFVTAVDGGAARRLTWWGDPTTKLIGWTPDGEVLVVSATGQPSRRHPWAYVVPPDGGTPRRLPLGPLADLAQRAEGPTVLLSATMTREMAWQKRYRGGTAGKLWWNPEGTFVRLAADLDGNLDAPMLVGDRIAFLSDHEGWGNLYSLGPDGTGLRRHTDHGADGAPAFYARHAATDGTRVVYESAGQLWLLDDLDAEPRPLDVRLGGPRTAREPYRITTGDWLGRVHPGHHRPVQHRHRPRHRAPAHPPRRPRPHPARHAPASAPGSRRRWATTARCGSTTRSARTPSASPRSTRAPPTRPRSSASAGELGRVLELVPAPDGESVALTTHDGRLLVLDPAEGAFRELARGGDGEVYDVTFSPGQRVAGLLRPGRLGPLTGRPRAAGRRRGGAGHRGPLPRRRPGVHPRRQAPRLPLAAQLRPDLRRARVRPHVPRVLAAVPGAAGRAHAVAVRGEPGRAPGLAGGRQAGGPARARPVRSRRRDRRAARGEGRRRRTRARRRSSSTSRGSPPAWCRSRSSRAATTACARPRTACSGTACPVSGTLGDGRAGTDVKPEKPVLERFDLARRKLDVIADPVSGYAVSGDGTRLVVRDGVHAAGAAHRPLRGERAHRRPGRRGRRRVPDRHAPRSSSPSTRPPNGGRCSTRPPASCATTSGWPTWRASTGRRRSRATARSSTPSAATTTSSTCCGSCRASWARRTPTSWPHRRPGSDGRPGLLGADLEPADDGWRVARVLPPETSDPGRAQPAVAARASTSGRAT